ncbi:MAG: ABC transporter ATP-binding protein, partial [Alphaproteobacteria bacterium]
MTTATANNSNDQTRLDSEADPNYRIDVSNLNTRVLWRISLIAFRHHWRMALAACAAILAGCFQLFVPQFIGQAVDQAQGLLAGAVDIASRDAARDALFNTALMLMSASVLRGLCTMVQNYQG